MRELGFERLQPLHTATTDGCLPLPHLTDFGLNPDSDDTGGLFHRDWRAEETSKLALIRKMPGTRVASILGEEPPLPQPPTLSPPAPPPPPSPLFASSLSRLFSPKPPPPLAATPPPPPLPAITRDFASERSAIQAHPIILGSSAVGGPRDGPGKAASASDLTMKLAAAGLAILLILAILRYNPHLAESIQGRITGRPPGRRPKLPLPVKALRPRPKGYDRVDTMPTVRDDSTSPPHDRSVPESEKPMARKPAARAAIAAAERKQASRRKPPTAAERAPTRQRAPAQSAPVEQQAGGSPQGIKLAPGVQVRVVGLQKAKQHNGKEGVLIAPIITAEHGSRWNIRMLTGELLALRPQNLEACGSAPSVQSMVDALERAGEHTKAALLRGMIPEDGH